MTIVGSFQKMATRIGPWFLQSKNIARFIQAVALTIDSAQESLNQGLALSNPLRCDSSALPHLSADRKIRLYPTEPDASRRLRLSQWLQHHRQRGTHQGELLYSQPYFLPAQPVMRIVHQAGDASSADWHTLDGSGVYTLHRQTPSNWNYDGHADRWSRFWAILYAPTGLVNFIHWDDGSTYDEAGVTYDGVVITQQAIDIYSMILEWQAAHSKLQAYILATDPASFDPTATATTSPDGWTSLPVGNWGSPISPPPVSIRTRLPTAVWLYEGDTT